MSLQRSTLDGARTAACVQHPNGMARPREDRAARQRRRIEHLPVFKDFSGRLYHLAVSVKAEKEARSKGVNP